MRIRGRRWRSRSRRSRPRHISLRAKARAHGQKRGDDRGTSGEMRTQQAELRDCFLALDVADESLRLSLD